MKLPDVARVHPPLAKAAALAAVVFILLFARAMTRPLDLDEHQFVAPAILLNHEAFRPYVDYPLFHTPALVWIYAAITRPFSDPLLIIRTFSALVGTCCVMLVFWMAFRGQRHAEKGRRWRMGLAVVALYMGARVFTYTNGWAWNHDASILAVLGAVILQLHGMRAGRVWVFFFVGLLVGASFTIRLTTAPVVGALGLAVLIVPSNLSVPRRIGAFLLAAAGTVLALLPTYLLYRTAPDAFWFGNFEYPQLYRLYVLTGNAHHTTMLGKIGHFFQTWFGEPGNLAVVLLVGLAVWRLCNRGYWRGKAGMEILTLLLVLVALWFGLSAPFQMQVQYHAVLLPFLLLLIVAVINAERFDPPAERRWLQGLTMAALAVLLVQFPRWYWPVVKLPMVSTWTPMRVEQTGDLMKRLVPAGSRVLTLDPIIPLEAGFWVYPQFATGRFVEHVGPFTTPQERRQFGMWYGDVLLKELAANPPGAILYSAGLEDRDAAELAAYAQSHHYIRHTLCPEVGVDFPVSPKQGYPDQTYVLWLPP